MIVVMLWKQWLAWPVHRLGEAMGLYAYTHGQRYALTYCVQMSATVPGTVTLAIPLPRETDYQHVKNLTVHTSKSTHMTDAVFGNSILVTTAAVSMHESELPVFTCEVEIKPRTVSCLNTSAKHSSLPQERRLMKEPRINELAARIGRGRCARETAERINAYIIRQLVYGDPIDGLYSDIDALIRPRVDCGGFVSLFVSLCLAHEIPARIVSGFWLDEQKNDMHAWAEFQDEQGRWIPVDPSVEQFARRGRTKKSGRFGFVGSDRLTLSLGSYLPLEWNNVLFSVPILQHPFILDGVPNPRVRAIIRLCDVS